MKSLVVALITRIGGVAVLGAVFTAFVTVAAAQTPAPGAAYQPPKTADGQPNLQGIWQVRNSANGDLEDHGARLIGDRKSARAFVPAGISVVEGKTLPYRPEAMGKKNENAANQETADPMAQCYMAGVPRVMYLPLPFQIFQTKDYVAIISEYTHNYRIIYVNGTKHVEGIEFWMGDSRGHWEGNTLVVDVIGFTDRTWLDMAGNYHSPDMHVVERYTPIDRDTLQYEATIEDPKIFTRPWKMSMPILRVKPSERTSILEYECANLQEEASGAWVDPPDEPPAK